MRLVIGLLLLTLLSCNKTESVNQRCVKGRYLTDHCEGVVIQVLDGTPIGREWRGDSSKPYQNCVVASLDTLAFKGLTTAGLFQKEATFYFQYRDGGYPQRYYVLCLPPPFITLTALFKTGCQ